MSVLFRTLSALNSIIFTIYAIRVTFFDYDLSKVDIVFACVMTALFSFSLAIGVYQATKGSDDQ